MDTNPHSIEKPTSHDPHPHHGGHHRRHHHRHALATNETESEFVKGYRHELDQVPGLSEQAKDVFMKAAHQGEQNYKASADYKDISPKLQSKEYVQGMLSEFVAFVNWGESESIADGTLANSTAALKRDGFKQTDIAAINAYPPVKEALNKVAKQKPEILPPKQLSSPKSAM